MAQNPFEKALADEGLVGTPLESLARSIYMQESGGGRNTKTSNAGAVGGMQILPGTFQEVLPGGDINDPYQNSVAGLRYIKKLSGMAGGDPSLVAAGYYGGPGGMQKAKQGVAVSDPRNPNAPTTLEYAKQVLSRTDNKGNVSRGTPKAIQENIANLGEGYQAAYALMAMADEEPETEREIEAREAAEEQSAAQQFAAIQKQLASVKPASPFAAQEPQGFKDGGEVEDEDKDEEEQTARRELQLFLKKATREESPLDVKFTAPPSQPMVQEGLGVMPAAPPSIMGRVGYQGDNFRAGASGVAVKTPQGVKYMPGMYDIGYRTPMAGGELDMSYSRGMKNMPGMPTPQMANVRYVRKFEEGGEANKDAQGSSGGFERFVAKTIGVDKAWDKSLDAPYEMGLSEDSGTRGDAVRHMTLMREIEKKYNPTVAKTLGYAHEFIGGPMQYFSNGEPQSSRDREMDLRNNALGLELSKQAGGDDAKFKELMRQALENKQADFYREEYTGKRSAPGGTKVRKRAEGSPEMGEVSGRTFEEGGPETAKKMLKDVARGVQFYPYDLVGAPVDIINMGLKGVDYVTGSKLATEKPVGGSAYLIDKSNKLGIAEKPTGSAAEELARFGSAFINPASGARATGRVLSKAGDVAAKGAEKVGLEATRAITKNPDVTAAQMYEAMLGQQTPVSAVAAPGESKKALQQLDVSMIKPTAESPFVGRLEQILFDNPQEVFNPQQLLGWGRKTLKGSDADRLEEAIKPLMGEKKLTKQQVLEQVNQTFSPKRFTIETTAVNEPIRGNTFISTYMGDDFPYKVDNVKKLGTIVARKPSGLNVDQLRLEGALDSVITHPEATEAYVRGIDTEIYNNGLKNIQMYLKEMPLDKANKQQAAQLFEDLTQSNRDLANYRYVKELHRDYDKIKYDMDEQERLTNLQGIAESLGLDSNLLNLNQLEKLVSSTLNTGTLTSLQDKAKSATDMMEFFLKKMSPEQAQFFPGRKGHEFQGANAISFSRYVDIPVGDKNLIGVSEYQSDLRRHLKKGLNKTKDVADIEVYPNMAKRDDELKQNMIKNVIYGAAKMEKDGVVLPGMMSNKAVLYTDVAKQAKAALKDMGLNKNNLTIIDPRKVYDPKKIDDKLMEMYSGMIDSSEATRVRTIEDIPADIKEDLLAKLSPYVIYLPKKDRSQIMQTGVPYAKGGLVEKKY